MPTYQCPDCNRLHEEPVSAEFALLVRCLTCEASAGVDAHRRTVRAERQERFRPAVAA